MGMMQKLMENLRRGDTKIGRKLYAAYTALVLVPLVIVGLLLIFSVNGTLTEHYISLLEADNRRVRTLFSDIAIRAYDLSTEVCLDRSIKYLLADQYETNMDFCNAVNGYTELDALMYSTQEIESVQIYTDNPTALNYKQFRKVDAETEKSDWYQRALKENSAFWVSIIQQSNNLGNNNLCLIRSIALPHDAYHAVAVIRVSDSYIRARVDTTGIVDMVSLDQGGIVYSSRWNWYGTQQKAGIDYADPYYNFAGSLTVDGEDYLGSTSVAHLYKTSSVLYVTTMDKRGIAEVAEVRNTWLLTLMLAVVVPGIALAVFAAVFAARVNLLREEMHKARNQDYDIVTNFSGDDELTEAFEDLKFMVQDIKERDAQMYEAELKENELRNKQQLMEYKMLASQINPHYLYNSLESIRMQALSVDDWDVVDSIRILGKTLHYVLENTGTSYTTLRKELQHVENYLCIQKLRFGDRVNYRFEVSPEVDADSYRMLPLLLQPVVENAVVHGLERGGEPGLVDIRVERAACGHIHITIRDNGKGMQPRELQTLQEALEAADQDPVSGIALYNINRRIRLSCGEDCGVLLESEYGKGTKVVLVLSEDF